MSIAQNEEVASNIISSFGFRHVTEILHLGIVFDNKLLKLQENWSKKVEIIKKLRNFFVSLNLPLTAKIDVIKTFMLSQLCYLAPVIKPDYVLIDEIKSIFLKFLSPNRNVFPVSRVFLEHEKGGLGIPNPAEFIEILALKFSFRSYASVQPWAKLLKSFFYRKNPCLASMPGLKPSYPSNCARLVDLLDSFNTKFFTKERFYSAYVFNY